MSALPGLTFSAPGVPLYAAAGSGANINLSTISVADTYLWEGNTYSTNTVGFYLAAESTTQLSLQTSGLYATLTLDGATGDLEIYPPAAVNIPAALNANTISTLLVETDAISTSQIDLDGQVLTANPTELLLNGIPLATTSNLSSIADWALDPAISSVNMSGFDLLSTQRGVFSTVIACNAVFNDVSTITLTSFSTLTILSTLSSLVLEGNVGSFSTLNSGTASLSSLSVSSLNGGVPITTANQSTIGNTLTLSNLNVSSIQGTQDVTILADAGAALDVPEIALTARNGTGGNISLLADTGDLGTSFGAINLTANGGITSGIGTGGSINITANTPLGTLCNASSKISLSAAGVNSYAGAVPPIGSLTGYNFMFGTLGINQTVGLPSVIPNFPGTLYQYAIGGVGYGGIRLESPSGVELIDNTDLYLYRVFPYFNPLFIGTLPDLTIAGRTHPVQNTQYITLSTVRGVEFGDNQTIGVIKGLSTINGIPVGNFENFSSISTFNQLFTSSLAASTVSADTAEVSTLNMNGTGFINWDGGAALYEPVPGQLFFTNGAGTTLELQPTQIQFNEAGGGQMLFVNNSLEVSAISTGSIVALANIQTSTLTLSPSTVLYSQTTDSELVVGTKSDPSDFAQIAASALRLTSSTTASNGIVAYGSLTDRLLFINNAAQTKTLAYTVDSNINVSTLTTSTLTFTGISTVSFTTASNVGAQNQPAGRLVMSGADLDLGQNDLYVQQIRVGLGNPGGSAQSEIIFASPNNASQRSIGMGTDDLTLRIQSTLNTGTNNGYILDTSYNPPFFSTLGGISTALMAVFPSTNISNIGAQVLSVIPPLVVAGNFLSLSTQNLAVNTPLVLFPEVTDFTTGGIGLSSSAIVIPSDGIYEFATSIQFSRPAGNGQADFWFRVNGTDVPNSASEIAMPSAGAGQTLGNVVFTKRLVTGDKLQLCVGTSDTGVSATFFQSTIAGAPFARPAVPSIILGVKCLNY